MEGNFDDTRRVVWGRADTLIWLDYPRYVVWPRLVRRNLGWWVSGTPTWSGNRMTLRVAVSDIRHGLRGYGAKRRAYLEMLPLYKNAWIFRFKQPSEAAVWLAEL